jgi:7-cyano-7-deazaguanine synthase
MSPSSASSQSKSATARKKAVVLLSGGLDSTTIAHIARDGGFDVLALSFDYGQRHRFELESAAKAAARVGALEHRVAKIDLRAFGGSALTDENIAVPMSDSADDIRSDAIPVTYVPARNTIFLSFAVGWAEVAGADDIFIGVNALDYSGYPDCRPEFIAAFQAMANLATARGVTGAGKLTIHTPLIDKTKAETIRWGLRLGVDYGVTHSCYSPAPDGRSCGHCDACLLRLRASRKRARPIPRRTCEGGDGVNRRLRRLGA